MLRCPERAPLGRTPGPASESSSSDASAGERTDYVKRHPLRIGHINSRSLLPSIDDIITTLDNQKLDILGVSETWLSPAVDDSFLIFPGYKIARRDRPDRGGGSRRGGGVCLLYRESLRVETLAVPTLGSPLESLWLSVCSTTPVVIGVIYRPPGAPVAAALDDLQGQLVHVCGTDKPLFVLGDVNFDWLQPAKPDVRRYGQVLEDVNVKQLVTEPTRPATGMLPDHIIVRTTDVITSTSVVPCSWSDQDIVIAETSLRRERRRPTEISVRSTRSLDPNALCLELLPSDWDSV